MIKRQFGCTKVRFAQHKLIDEIRLPNGLLILISHGFSYDHDYEDPYAREDTRVALHEAQLAGSACVCLSIGGSRSTEQPTAAFGAANLLMVDDSGQWQAQIGKVCQ